jgi:hypothetical protein
VLIVVVYFVINSVWKVLDTPSYSSVLLSDPETIFHVRKLKKKKSKNIRKDKEVEMKNNKENKKIKWRKMRKGE